MERDKINNEENSLRKTRPGILLGIAAVMTAIAALYIAFLILNSGFEIGEPAQTPTMTSVPRSAPTITVTTTPTTTATQNAAIWVKSTPPKTYMVKIDDYLLIPVGGKVINRGDTITFKNFEQHRQARVLVSEDVLWDGKEKYLQYMRSVSYTFNETGVYTFYLKGREHNKWDVTVE